MRVTMYTFAFGLCLGAAMWWGYTIASWVSLLVVGFMGG